MQAMHGLRVSLRKRGRLVGCCAVLALALSAMVIAPAGANAAAEPTTTYLALGDSISFGFTAEKFAIHKPNESPSYFEEGFTDYFTKTYLRKATEVGPSIRLVNDGCPGETSNGLIGEKASIGGKTSTEGPEGIQGPGDWHPCRYHFVNGFPLHNSLATTSQLEDALVVLGKENTKVITVQAGSNDELAGVEECKKEIKEEFESKFYSEQPNSKSAPGDPEDGTKFFVLNGDPKHDAQVQYEAFVACAGGKSQYVTFPRIIENINKIVNVIDSTGYANPIVVQGYYNPDAFVLPGSDTLQEILNFQLKKSLEESALPNLHWMNPMPKFNHRPGTAKQEKEAVKKYTEMCNPNVQKTETCFDPGCEGDIHPSLVGYKQMAKEANLAYLAPALP
jgi:lysophospholipase L1-like esterase